MYLKMELSSGQVKRRNTFWSLGHSLRNAFCSRSSRSSSKHPSSMLAHRPRMVGRTLRQNSAQAASSPVRRKYSSTSRMVAFLKSIGRDQSGRILSLFSVCGSGRADLFCSVVEVSVETAAFPLLECMVCSGRDLGVVNLYVLPQ